MTETLVEEFTIPTEPSTVQYVVLTSTVLLGMSVSAIAMLTASMQWYAFYGIASFVSRSPYKLTATFWLTQTLVSLTFLATKLTASCETNVSLIRTTITPTILATAMSVR